ncbi:MAG: hypothetical protein HXX10_03245 [Rhodoplanes sp.]|uniref:hypothetical protein n=1 Tax=Rhodoplanes sp. TaxID=1968906 RepID=UPI0017D2C8D3|nr:hypothetical protein [Rhodoplanes sp.]NVO13031.1 hypothetical protein [Rhodoplanes sp.]
MPTLSDDMPARPVALAMLIKREVGAAVSARQLGYLVQAVYALRHRSGDASRPTEAAAGRPEQQDR